MICLVFPIYIFHFGDKINYFLICNTVRQSITVFWWDTGHIFVETRWRRITRVIGQCLGGPIFTWGDQVPDETFDVLISTVVQQTVGQKGPADRLHIRLLQRALEATVSQDVTPPAPTEDPQVKTIYLVCEQEQSHNWPHKLSAAENLQFSV